MASIDELLLRTGLGAIEVHRTEFTELVSRHTNNVAIGRLQQQELPMYVGQALSFVDTHRDKYNDALRTLEPLCSEAKKLLRPGLTREDRVSYERRLTEQAKYVQQMYTRLFGKR